MEHLRSMTGNASGYKIGGWNLPEEMKELARMRTALMMEKCLGRSEVVVCPKPRRRGARSNGEHNDIDTAVVSEILTSKASPPYYIDSPPIRCNNPLAQDAHFCKQRDSPVPVRGVVPKGLDSAFCQ